MQVIREFRELDSNEIVIRVPPSFKEKQVEIIVLPIPRPLNTRPERRKLRLTTFKCHGKKRDFSRDDAYADRI